MVTETLIRKKFVHETFSQGLQELSARQRSAFSTRFDSRTGRLLRQIGSPPVERRITDDGYHVAVTMYTYLRFLDMQYRRQDGTKRRKKGLIYNKVVWPLLFREVFPELRYGLTDEVRQELRDQLKRAVEV